MRLATLHDLPLLLDLMRGYYRDDGLELHLEIDWNNSAAQRLYSQLGYTKRDRYYLMTARLEISS